MVVFFTFWQETAITILVAYGVIRTSPLSRYTADNIADGIQVTHTKKVLCCLGSTNQLVFYRLFVFCPFTLQLTYMHLILVQNFLICIEMFAAAIAHIYAFPVTDFRTPYAALIPDEGSN